MRSVRRHRKSSRRVSWSLLHPRVNMNDSNKTKRRTPRIITAQHPVPRLARLIKVWPEAITRDLEWRGRAPPRGGWRDRWTRFRLWLTGISIYYVNRGDSEAENWIWYARQFTDAAWANKCAAGDTPWMNIPSYYLLIHAMELALK